MSEYAKVYNVTTENVNNYIIEKNKVGEIKLILPIVYYWLTYKQRLDLIDKYMSELNVGFEVVIETTNPLKYYNQYIKEYKIYFDNIDLTKDNIMFIKEYALFLEHFNWEFNKKLEITKRLEKSIKGIIHKEECSNKIAKNILNIYLNFISNNKEYEISILKRHHVFSHFLK